jgi:hypothetical protein
MPRVTLVFLILLNTSCLLAQEKVYEEMNPEKVSWSNGSIQLNNGEKLSGLIRYNDANNLLSFNEDGSPRSFTPRSVTRFEFYDELLKRQRLF